MAQFTEAFLGEIRMFAGNYAPEGWAICDGGLLDISQFQALFAVIGTYYGGDGRTNFAVPDLRGRVAIGAGTGICLSTRHLGNRGGTEREIITINNMPQHTHHVAASCQGSLTAQGTVLCTDSGTDTNNPEGKHISKGSPTVKTYSDGTPNKKMAEGNVEINLDAEQLQIDTNTSPVGSGQSHSNMQPWTCVNYIICVDGLFPPRS